MVSHSRHDRGFWTKPNQGQLFKQNRDLIMGVERQAGEKGVAAKKA